MAGNLSWRVFPLHFRSQHLFTQVRSAVFILRQNTSQPGLRNNSGPKVKRMPWGLKAGCKKPSNLWGIISLKPCVCSNYWMTKGIVNISNIGCLQEARETISISSRSPVPGLDSLCGSTKIWKTKTHSIIQFSKSQQFSILADCRLKQLDGDKWNAALQICIFYEKTFISTSISGRADANFQQHI